MTCKLCREWIPNTSTECEDSVDYKQEYQQLEEQDSITGTP